MIIKWSCCGYYPDTEAGTWQNVASIIREMFYVIKRAILDFWNWQSCPQAHYIIRGSLGTLTEGMQGWREALHPTLASPSTCIPQYTALTGPSELVCEGFIELLLQVLSTAQIYDSYDSTVINQQWVKVAEHVLCQSELFPADPRIDTSHTFTLLPEWWLYIQIRLSFFLSQCWHCKFSMLEV